MHMYDLTAENVAVIDLLEDRKRPPTPLHAIYFLLPVRLLMADFVQNYYGVVGGLEWFV